MARLRDCVCVNCRPRVNAIIHLCIEIANNKLRTLLADCCNPSARPSKTTCRESANRSTRARMLCTVLEWHLACFSDGVFDEQWYPSISEFLSVLSPSGESLCAVPLLKLKAPFSTSMTSSLSSSLSDVVVETPTAPYLGSDSSEISISWTSSVSSLWQHRIKARSRIITRKNPQPAMNSGRGKSPVTASSSSWVSGRRCVNAVPINTPPAKQFR